MNPAQKKRRDAVIATKVLNTMLKSIKTDRKPKTGSRVNQIQTVKPKNLS